MTPDIGSMLPAAACLVALSGYQLTQQRAWADRGITPVANWTSTLLVQIAVGTLAALLTQPTWGTPASVAAAGFAWLGVLAVATDIKTRKVPWDISHPVALIGLIAFAFQYTIEGLLALGAGLVGTVVIPLLARWITNKGLGMSDIRLLWAATASCAWWAGQTWLLYALIAAAVIQIPIRLAAKPLHLGAMVPVPSSQPTSDEPPRTRLELPFAPALVMSLYVAVGYATYTGYGACMMWNPLSTC